jgi:PAS domain S-box-containing protein
MTDRAVTPPAVERRRARNAAAASLRAVAEAVHDAIGCVDEQGRITMWIGGAPALFGWSAAEALGRSMWDMVSAEDRARYEPRFDHVAAGGTGPILGGQPLELQARRRDGSTFPAELTLSRGELHGRLFFAVALRDVTSRRAAEAALALADERFRSAFRHAAAGMTMSTPHGRYLAVNGAFCALVDRPEADLIGCSDLDITHPEDSEGAPENVRALDRGERDAVHVEKRYVRPDGSSVWVEGSISLVRDDAGAPQHYISQWVDVTERRRTAAELARSNGELAQLAAVAAHDLNEPLRIVDGFLRLLEGRAGDALDDEGRRFVSEALAGAGRMRELIDALLRYASVGGGTIQRGRVDLGQVAGEAAAALEAGRAHRGTALDIGALPIVDGDAALLRQVLQNLLANAIRHADAADPRVEVSAHGRRTAWEIRVRDNGCGIPPALRSAAFDLFARGEDGGTGLGLAICRRAVERHGGRIWIEEAAPGADLRFTIPRRDPA